MLFLNVWIVGTIKQFVHPYALAHLNVSWRTWYSGGQVTSILSAIQSTSQWGLSTMLITPLSTVTYTLAKFLQRWDITRVDLCCLSSWLTSMWYVVQKSHLIFETDSLTLSTVWEPHWDWSPSSCQSWQGFSKVLELTSIPRCRQISCEESEKYVALLNLLSHLWMWPTSVSWQHMSHWSHPSTGGTNWWDSLLYCRDFVKFGKISLL